ncbi:hypothetical protein BJV77DRAFT_1065927 [Russula vinacea]|nr:hypothetical protein BJV77DRAFT_1065927 [Russula vinacea]
MTFLGFRHAKRKAKKMVNIRPLRSPTPSSGSLTTSIVEIGDPSGASAEACHAPVTLDVDITPEPRFLNDPFSSTVRHHASSTNPRQLQDRLSRSVLGRSLPKPLRDETEWVQPRNGRVAGSAVVGDIIRTPDSRRAGKATPAPIKIPTPSHAHVLQIRRSAGKSAEPHPASVNPRDSPVLEDTASAVSGMSLPAALITSAWTTQTDQPRDCHLSRRITRLDSATLPVDPFLQKFGNGDGVFHVGVNAEAASHPTNDQDKCTVGSGDKGNDSLRDFFSACKPSRISFITELTIPDPSDSGTPDLIKDSSTSAGGGSSDAQPNTSTTSDSASSGWSGPRSSSSLASKGGIVDVFSATPSDHKLPSEGSGASSFLSQAGLPTGERNDGPRTRLAGQRRTSANPEFHRRPLSRSSPRPSLASVNSFILHPATLRPVSERRTSVHAARKSVASSHVTSSDDANRLSALPSSLPATRSQIISHLPSFPGSAVNSSTATSSVFPSSSTPPSSPDLLDNIVLEDSGREGQWHTSRESGSTVPTSGSSQTFPETPPIFSPMFSPEPRPTLSILDSSTRQRAFVLKSIHGRRTSQKFISRRAASAKATIGTKAYEKSFSIKLRRSSTITRTPALPSSLSTVINNDAMTTTKSDQVGFGDDLSTHPQSVSSSDSPDFAYLQGPVIREHSESPRKTLTLPVLLSLPPLPQSPPPSPQKSAVEFESNSTSPSLFSLPPPPPPPQLHLPLPPPSPPPPSSPIPRADPPSADIPSVDESQVRFSLSYHPSPAVPSVTPPGNSLAPPSSSPGCVPVNLPLNMYNSDRPPRPLGPRAPYRNASVIPGMTVTGVPEQVSGRSSVRRGSSSEPRFQTSPAKFKTLTMEAAMWTFSPEELHTLMSQAIGVSRQASSIRLLSQQAALVEIPEELGRLNVLLDELTVQYRLQVRKRNVLLRASYEYADSPEPSSIAFRSKMQELHETALTLDGIAEEMYHARDQAAQLSRMLAVHSGSALAVVLRNLNSSYLKRTADMQSLKDHVSALEAECDEAWTQAQQVARDLDDLNSTMQTHSSSVSSPSSPLGLFPPVPGIPGSLASLNRIITSGLSSQNSDVSSPSGRRALAQAQADLCKYLGIDDPELMPRPSARRSLVVASPLTTSPVARDGKERTIRRMSDITDHRMTRGGGLSDQFQAFLKNESDAPSATVER